MNNLNDLGGEPITVNLSELGSSSITVYWDSTTDCFDTNAGKM